MFSLYLAAIVFKIFLIKAPIMNKFFYYGMATIFAITYHFTKTTTIKQKPYNIIAISCDNHANLNAFYNKHFAHSSLNKSDKKKLNIQSFAHYFDYLKEDVTFCKKTIIAITQDNNCIGFLAYKDKLKDGTESAGEYFYQNNNKSIRDYHYGCIDFLYIKPEYRLQGYATHLILHLLQLLKHQAYSHARLVVKADNTKAINLYQKLGFFPLNPQKNMIRTWQQQTQELLMSSHYLLFEKSLT